jgi:hypothetical protein
MNSNIKIFLLCPVPEEQKPINTYIGLKENPLTHWTTLSKTNYEKKIISFFLFFFGITSLVRFSELKSFFFGAEWLLVNLIVSFSLLMFLLIIIFARWQQLEKDLNEPRLFYEEASWYDGEIWEKPFAILKNDRLLSTQKIKPILQRILRTLFRISSYNLACFFFFFFK